MVVKLLTLVTGMGIDLVFTSTFVIPGWRRERLKLVPAIPCAHPPVPGVEREVRQAGPAATLVPANKRRTVSGPAFRLLRQSFGSDML